MMKKAGYDRKENLMQEKIIEIIEDVLQVPAGTVTIKTKAEDMDAWDSLAQVLIVGELESRLGISIPIDEAADLVNVEDFVRKAEELRA